MNPSLYIHIPVCLRKCDYCDFFSLPLHQVNLAKVVETLCHEITFRETEVGATGWKTVYIGGGTPSLLSADEITRLCAHIHPQKSDEQGTPTEWTIEANPEDITIEWLDACQKGGINRLSMGIQSMNDTLLRGIGRRGSREANLRALALVQKHWKGRLSLDLIAGLPSQTMQTLLDDVREILSYHPDHVSLYALTIEEGTPLEAKLSGCNPPSLPDEDDAAELWIAGRDMLEHCGYTQYEISNFAPSGFESVHNKTYWNLDSYVGVGPGATGTTITGDRAYRHTNTENLSQWLERPFDSFLSEEINRQECIEEFLLMGMRVASGISRKRFKDRFGSDILELIPLAAADWKKRGLLVIDDDKIALNRDGLLLLNRFLADCMEDLCKK